MESTILFVGYQAVGTLGRIILDGANEVRYIKDEVDWNLEAGAMVRRSNELGSPPLFFQKIKGYSPEYKMFGEMFNSHRRVAIAMGMKPEVSAKELIEEYRKRKQHSIKPKLVSNGPCKENIHIADDVNLLEFPVPFVHQGDGGRYIGTSHVTICKDLNGDWVNWGTYRSMMHNKNTIGLQAGPPTHITRIRKGWESLGKPMEVAIAIGVEPVSLICAAAPIAYGISEVDIIGGIRGEPVELVKCETVNLEVPATSEIVIEGVVGIGENLEEGPFGEYTVYMGSHREPRPIIHVKAVTHRNNPILIIGNEGTPVTTTHATQSITRSAECIDILSACGLPVKEAYEFINGCTLVLVVAIKEGQVRADDVAHAIWGSRLGVSTPYIVVVADDVDPFDLTQVFHAVVSKCHPIRGINRLDHA